jgi:hypothetical protein
MGNKNTGALSGPLVAPAGYGGMNAPVAGAQADADASTLRVERAVNSASAPSTGGKASADAQQILKIAAAMVVGGTVLLWVFGGIVFKNANI